MWTPYTRRTSCHEQKHRDAASRLIFAFFRSKRRLSVNLGFAPPYVPSGLYRPGTPPSPISIIQTRAQIILCRPLDRNPLAPQHAVPVSLLTHKGGFLYTPSHLKQVLITSPSILRVFFGVSFAWSPSCYSPTGRTSRISGGVLLRRPLDRCVIRSFVDGPSLYSL